MKDVQRLYNLSSYRLDYIASNFIKWSITNINILENKNVELYCDNINDINVKDYIHIEIIIIDKDDNLLNISLTEYKLCWSYKLKIILHQKIFLHLIKVCQKIEQKLLNNVLINKLEVITKNIEISNVCFVHLSYLFIRGQGIKIFSLCLKEYNTHGYLFSVLIENKSDCKKCKKKNAECYEGI